MNITIRVLDKNDNKEYFECGNVDLDQFFKKYASQNQFKHYIGTTYVAVIDNIIVGYVTISASSIKVAEYDNLNKKLPKYPLPILRVSRFAVDKEYQKKGIGKELLKFVLKLSVEQKNMFGSIGIVVDAKEKAVDFYKQFGFEIISINNGELDIRPYPKTMYLSMNTILKAMK